MARNAASSRSGAVDAVERGHRGRSGIGRGSFHGLGTGAYHEMFQTITGHAALEITSAGGVLLAESLLEVVRKTPGVATAVPVVQRNAIMYYGNGRLKLMALGIDPLLDAAVRDYDLVEGQPLSKSAGVLLDAALAQNLGVRAGDEVKLLVRRGLVTTKVVGLVKPRSGSAVSGGGVLFMPLATAQRRFAAKGMVDRIQVVLADGADVSAVQSQLGTQLPDGLQVQPPSTRSSLAEETMLALENGLRLATAFSLLAAVFIIMNTFLMNVGQRRQQLAVMRAIGATAPTSRRFARPRSALDGAGRHVVGHRAWIGRRNTLELHDEQSVSDHVAVDRTAVTAARDRRGVWLGDFPRRRDTAGSSSRASRRKKA